MPYLATKVGDDIVTASGTTLLGADDKAGVAIVMAMARHLLANPDLAHGPIRICFTPDEEIGRGVHANLPDDLQADVAYTLDGAELGEIVYETFSADKATVTIEGVSIHPGQAKDMLVNALHLAAKIIMTLPHVTLTPETTDGRQGFIHLYQMSGSAAAADAALHPARFRAGGAASATASCCSRSAPPCRPPSRGRGSPARSRPQYRNMRYWLEDDMRPVELAREACRQLGRRAHLHPDPRRHRRLAPDRAGRADAQPLHRHAEIHGPLEWVSVQDMARATEMCIKLAQLWSGEPRDRGSPTANGLVANRTSMDWWDDRAHRSRGGAVTTSTRPPGGADSDGR